MITGLRGYVYTACKIPQAFQRNPRSLCLARAPLSPVLAWDIHADAAANTVMEKLPAKGQVLLFVQLASNFGFLNESACEVNCHQLQGSVRGSVKWKLKSQTRQLLHLAAVNVLI